MKTVTSDPATKADLEPLATKAELAEAIDRAVEPLATKADLEPLATKAELAEAIDRAVEPLATKADLEGLATKADVEQLRAEMYVDIARAVNAGMESTRDWMKAHAEQMRSETAVTNAYAAKLREELEAHRDDLQVHRASPRRRRS